MTEKDRLINELRRENEELRKQIRPHAKWIWDKHNGEYYCSECKEVQEDIKTVMGFPDWNFCPNCGADMRGEQNG